MLIGYSAKPHGHWDAWAIWNLKARFLYRLDGVGWRNLFSDEISWSHGDYPLEFPLIVSKTWGYMGQESVLGPIIIALVVCMAIIMLGCTAIYSRSKIGGLLYAVLLTSSSIIFASSITQYADMMLAYYILATIVCLSLYDNGRERDTWLVVVSGFLASSCAWIKNEGFLFVLVLILSRIVILILRREQSRIFSELKLLVCGMIVPLGYVLIFKFLYCPQSDLFIASDRSFLELISDFERIKIIFANVVARLDSRIYFFVAALVMYLAYGSMTLFRQAILPIIVSIGIFVGYIFIYLITPRELTWHIDRSFLRLLSHIYPVLAYGYVLCLDLRLCRVK